MSTPEHPDTPETPPTPPLPPTHHPYGAVPPQQPAVPPVPGQPVPPGPPAPGYYPGYAPQPPTDGMAIASLVLGIIGVTMICGYGIGIIPAIIAIVLGRKAKRTIDASQGRIGGRGLAQAGFVLGVVTTAIVVVLLVCAAVFFGLVFGTDCFGEGC